jgi:hypothetical protein
MLSRYSTSVLVLMLFVFVPILSGDTVQLMNGDTISGKVLSLDDKHLKLHSEALGQIVIERGKIASIHLGDTAVPKKTALPKASGAQDLIDQLRGQGIDPKTVNDIKKAFPLLATPEAGKYFDNALSGLLGGSMNIQDVRKDAIKAMNEIKKLEKELGPQATQALQSYIGILENFIRETEPSKQLPKAQDPPSKQKK